MDYLWERFDMSGAQQAVFMNQRSFGPPPPGAIGSAYEGGFYAGQISTAGNGVADFYLVVAPKSSGEDPSIKCQNISPRVSVPATRNDINGPANTAAMIASGISHPAASFCVGLSIGGFSDWYMPAKNELEVCYYNLKPTTSNNGTAAGTNTNAVPSRGSNYTVGTPAQTSATDFKTGNTQAFESVTTPFYWSSSEDPSSTTRNWVQSYSNGNQFSDPKDNNYYVRAVRRVAV
jgi:hypothetical protein